jgi:RNA polymerase sigma-70 factor (ECF subfamily)
VWLVKIAANVLADQRQRAGREQVADGVESFDYSEVRDSSETTQQILEETEASAILFQMVDQLPNDQRRVIVLRFAYEKSIAEIAKELERSEGAIKQLQFRGLENLRERLNRQRGEQDA